MKKKIIRYSLGTLLFLLLLISLLLIRSFLFWVAVFFIIVGLKEYRKMLANIEIYPHKFLPEIASIIIAFILCISTNPVMDQFFVMPTIIIGILLSFIITILKNKKPYMLTTFSTIGGILLTYCGMYLIKLTHLKGNDELILVYILTVLLSDYIASIVGKKIKNKKPIAEEISPNKTVAGTVAHLLTSVIASVLICTFGMKFNILFSLFFGTIISVFAQLGDLAVSTIKRECNVEHSGTFFLNYGGFLDRMDAFIFSAPAIFYYLAFLSYIFKG